MHYATVGTRNYWCFRTWSLRSCFSIGSGFASMKPHFTCHNMSGHSPFHGFVTECFEDNISGNWYFSEYCILALFHPPSFFHKVLHTKHHCWVILRLFLSVCISVWGTLQEEHLLLTGPGIVLQWLPMGLFLKFSPNFPSKARLKYFSDRQQFTGQSEMSAFLQGDRATIAH